MIPKCLELNLLPSSERCADRESRAEEAPPFTAIDDCTGLQVASVVAHGVPRLLPPSSHILAGAIKWQTQVTGI